MSTEQKGMKYDSEKIQLELLSTKWLLGVGRVLTFGAKKYASHNWRKGIQQSRLLGASLRHILAYLDGEDLDQESGLSHLFHASCCLMFAAELKETRPDLDDRYGVNQATADPSELMAESPSEYAARIRKEIEERV